MHNPLEHRHANYLISDDPARLDVAAVHAYLSRAYWSEGIPLEIVQRALKNSLCIGAYDLGEARPPSRHSAVRVQQIGLTRFITDSATFCYVCDVYVLEEHRGHGLAKAMLSLADRHPRLHGLRRWNLVTRDAHKLYAEFGFSAIRHPESYMERLDPEVYRRQAGEEYE